ncbi:MAG: hypothetical protein WBW74_13560 [Xanthobacteraceae bacterium]
MRKSLTALVVAATIAVAAIATPTPADARRGWWGPAIGSLAIGAIIGSVLARPAYGYYGGYYGYPAYGYAGYGYGGYGYGGYGYAPAYYGYSPGYYYAPRPYYGCWRWRRGYRYRVC